MNEIRDLIVGIDFGKESTQICYYDRKAEEPLSLSMKTGSEQYEAPTLLTRRVQGDYVVGLEAEYFASEKDGERIPDLYQIAQEEEEALVGCAGEELHPWELLAFYLKGILRYLGVADLNRNAKCIGVTAETLNTNMVHNFSRAFSSLGFQADQVILMDHEEAFYYYVMSQKRELLNRSVAWYIFEGNQVTFRKMTVNFGARPAEVRLAPPGMMTTLPEEAARRDQEFAQFIDRTLGTELYASIQISGNGFAQEWALESVKKLCFQRRKVYFGNNLFARGVCAAGKERKEDRRMKGYRFLSNALVQKDVGMEMRIMGSPTYYSLIEGGKNWYECETSCELILDDTDQLIFVVSTPGESEKKRRAMPLPGLPDRPNRTTRLALSLYYRSAKECVVTVKDLGFGEMFPSTGKVWKETVEW